MAAWLGHKIAAMTRSISLPAQHIARAPRAAGLPAGLLVSGKPGLALLLRLSRP
jgi:hypothetical protein